MKPCELLTGLILVALAPIAARAVSSIPERRDRALYDKVAAESAFAVATPTAPVAEPVKGWASNLYVAALGKSYVNGKEEVYAGIRSRTDTVSFSLFGNDPGFEDISIAGVDWADNLKSKVTLKKGSEFATVQFDPQVAQTAPAAAPARPQDSANPNRPVNLGPGRSLIRPPAPSAVPRPQSVPLPQAAPVPRPANTNNTTTPDAQRRTRVRVIKSP